jgi:flagellar motor switch protein FliM
MADAMQLDDSSTILQRKAKVARQEHDARALTPGKALRLALELTGDALYKLAMTVDRVEERSLAHADLRAEVARLGGPMGTTPQEGAEIEAEQAPDPADLTGPLLLLLDGPEGARGAVTVGRALVQALIEVQTMGKVSGQRPPERAFTPTDAAVCAPLLNTLFAGFGDKMEELREGVAPLLAYRFGDRVEDARALGLALEAERFELIELEVDVARGRKTGTLTVLLPAPLLPPPPRDEAEEEAASRFNLAALAMQAPVTLNAVLDWVEMPLKEVCALKPGALIPVAAQALDRTELVASQGHVVAKVRLGQMNGFRAVRFTQGPQMGAGDTQEKMEARGALAAKDVPERHGLNGGGDFAPLGRGQDVAPAALPGLLDMPVETDPVPPEPMPADALPGIGGAIGGDGLTDLGALETGMADVPALDAGGTAPDSASDSTPGELPGLADLPDLPKL